MNRLILVGNGFDLAHGLKTSYRDFIDDFWDDQIKKINFNLLVPEISTNYYEIKQHGDTMFRLADSSNYTSLISNLKPANAYIKFKNNFLELITDNCYQNWVDIENEYYNELKKGDINIDELNKNFNEVKELLIKYLKKIKKNNSNKITIEQSIYSLFNIDDLVTISKIKFKNNIKEIIFGMSSTELDQEIFLKNLKTDM